MLDADANLYEAVNVQHQDLSTRNDELIDTGNCMRPAAQQLGYICQHKQIYQK